MISVWILNVLEIAIFFNVDNWSSKILWPGDGLSPLAGECIGDLSVKPEVE